MYRPLKIKRALISVSDKSHLEDIAQALVDNNVEIISSGGTGKYLSDKGIPWTAVEKVTGNPEAFGGRMKTLSFQISSSLLYRRDHNEDIQQALELGIEPIDLVICNLYPFVETAKKTSELATLIENIDIGGPTMVRAAAKNFKDVLVCVNPNDYESIIEQLQSSKGVVSFDFRQAQALKAFKHTAEYDVAISQTLSNQLENDIEKESLYIPLSRGTKLRYGENPHQWAKVVCDQSMDQTLADISPLQGKALSYNNLLDADAAFRCTSDLNKVFPEKFITTIIKHANPCGVAMGTNSLNSLEKAWAGDPISSFGSIVCFNKEIDVEVAHFLTSKFVEVVIAPRFTEGALRIFSSKKNLRVIKLSPIDSFKNQPMVRSIYGGWVVQEEDCLTDVEFQPVTRNLSCHEDLELLSFGSIVTKHLKSNAISLVCRSRGDLVLAGAGMGNPNRLVSTEQAISKAIDNDVNLSECTLISDAFFPFRDNVDLAKKYRINRIVQPGGSIKDNEVIQACDEHGISMCFTGRRHFRH
ncbi:bifunctional phosphoribosylaminoimidazolecarboxamide formyltransferase/IMP cyclohydrolase [Bacteriovorax sp. DB6_IX]|uniref:bifunctional phosphoribosylaminoimidazolecarboxamide formyltransferase/IMP cyclohydrolase n=1 Tax=Bacteriovorax sp. DB6_IX TaxID=1353530 RepID=UPI000389E457|nr:bifunctional phosphoribosylaminoimidazolecarboxamide formyltransferase/IMP cyclohydrolase [Bacteriovorax sp. DB6_IX]EQC51354.1 putative phosphoribosylaminoimidazolecarboxamide formyltransferase/IMP cyclohydrolase [Bacteriovorax sp. DB6_IX]